MNIRKLLMQVNQAEVCRKLGWSEEQYNELQLETGLQFLQLYSLPEYADNKVFWAWFRNQWDMRDERFLLSISQIPTLEREDKYLATHSILNNSFFPPHNIINYA
ncbi:hypothetical protein SAMN05421780_101576 [Flexibacter flexilis DSM 6793]|uniref:Uncharacterized protein n=1 Tax=Flexibacter flexilis DSM 6793 TaxID=927664 RepID=A0A1I1E7M9_9BACT|nr:hypothetical protein [Flexibacter flexilis]SFB80970.1 hypothetical protein SAMN05421780_101576 [Flexibacter flexilis DSM 6793]